MLRNVAVYQEKVFGCYGDAVEALPCHIVFRCHRLNCCRVNVKPLYFCVTKILSNKFRNKYSIIIYYFFIHLPVRFTLLQLILNQKKMTLFCELAVNISTAVLHHGTFSCYIHINLPVLTIKCVPFSTGVVCKVDLKYTKILKNFWINVLKLMTVKGNKIIIQFIALKSKIIHKYTYTCVLRKM